jgi:tetratricopeptide (TPR) repeat protein
MNIWDVLQISKNNNVVQIRNAYVDVLCATKVEDFTVEGFLTMREAYSKALLFARTGDYEDYEIPEDVASLRVTKGNIAYIEPILGIREMTIADAPKPGLAPEVASRLNDIVRLYTSMMALHDDFYSRIELDYWKELMQTDLLINMKIIHFMRLPVLTSCIANPLLPQNVWVFLDHLFHWSDQLFSIPKDYEVEKKLLAIETDPRWALSFSRFRLSKSLATRTQKDDQPIAKPTWEHKRTKKPTSLNIDFEQYATYRRNMRNAIIEENDEAAEKWFIMSAELFDGDPDLFVLCYEFMQGRRGEGQPTSTELFQGIVERLLDFYPEHIVFLISRVDCMADQKLYTQAIIEYKKLAARFPDSLLVLYQLSEVYLKSGQEGDAKKTVKTIEKNYPAVQALLKTGRSHSLDAVSVKEQYLLNDQVMKNLERDKLKGKSGSGLNKK